MKKSRLITGVLAAAVVIGGVAASTPALAASIGTEWNSATVPAGASGQESVAFGDGIFISVDRDGVIYRSTDGKSWTEVDSKGLAWYGVTYGGGVFVVVGNNDYASSSDGGLTWTAPANFDQYWYYTVAYGNGVFVTAEGDDCSNWSQTSPDGVTWTSHSAAMNASPCWQDIAFSGTNFVAVGDQDVEYSTNGVTWTNSTLPSSFTSGNGSLYNLATDGAGTLLAIGTEFNVDVFDTVLLKSTDNGVTWTQLDSDKFVANRYNSVAYGNSTWMLGEFWGQSTNTTGGMLRSVDGGATWTAESAPEYQWNDIVFGADTFVAVGQPDVRVLGLDNVSPIAWSTATATLPDTGASDYGLIGALSALFLIAGAGAMTVTMVRRRQNS